MACDLLMPDGDEINRAFAKSSQYRDIGVAAQAKHVFDFASFQKVDDVFCDGFAVHLVPSITLSPDRRTHQTALLPKGDPRRWDGHPSVVHHVFHCDIFVGDVAAPNAATKAGRHRHTIGPRPCIGFGLRLAHHHPADRGKAGKTVDVLVIVTVNAAGMPFAAGVVDCGYRFESVVESLEVIKRHKRG